MFLHLSLFWKPALWRWRLSHLLHCFTIATPKGGQLLTYNTHIHVACRVSPDTAGKGVAARGQNCHPQCLWLADVRRGWNRSPDSRVSVRKRTKSASKTTRPLLGQCSNISDLLSLERCGGIILPTFRPTTTQMTSWVDFGAAIDKGWLVWQETGVCCAEYFVFHRKFTFSRPFEPHWICSRTSIRGRRSMSVGDWFRYKKSSAEKHRSDIRSVGRKKNLSYSEELAWHSGCFHVPGYGCGGKSIPATDQPKGPGHTRDWPAKELHRIEIYEGGNGKNDTTRLWFTCWLWRVINFFITLHYKATWLNDVSIAN